MKVKTEDEMIRLLDEKFKLNIVPREMFDGEDSGLWVCDDICKPETDYYNYFEGTMEKNKLNDFLESCGWGASAYDSETIMLYEI